MSMTPAPRQDATSLQSLATARDALLARLGPIAPEVVALRDALGLALAERLTAPAQLPGSATALRDGVAAPALDTVGAGPYAPAPLPSASAPVRSGEALPHGCDAVLPPDAVTGEGGRLWALTQVAPGENARLPGQDLAAGAGFAEAGWRLNPVRWALALRCGLAEVRVRRPRVAVAPGADPDAACSAALLAALLDSDRAVLRVTEARDADLVLVPGKVAAGAAGIALVPAASAGVGVSGNRPAILAPPRPEATLAVWLGLARPAIDRLMGITAMGVADTAGTLARKLVSTVGVADLSVLSRDPFTGDLSAWTPLATGDIPWSALAAADAALLTDPGSEGAPAGSAVRAMLL